MKIVALVLMLFFLSFALKSRELTAQERLSLLGLESSKSVMTYMMEEIDTRALGFRQRIIFETAKRACSPLDLLLKQIDSALDLTEMNDQSKNLAPLMYGCLSGTVQLSEMYRLQRS